jgi:hypothetical protein
VSWSAIEAHRDYIHDQLKAGVTAATSHQRLRDEHGLEASVASLRRWVRANLPEDARREQVRVLRPDDTQPGSEAGRLRQARDVGRPGLEAAAGGRLRGRREPTQHPHRDRGGRSCSPPTTRVDATASTEDIPRSSSLRRRALTCPEASSPVTHAAGTPPSRARSSIVSASSGFVANPISAGTPASAHRSQSSVQDFGR